MHFWQKYFKRGKQLIMYGSIVILFSFPLWPLVPLAQNYYQSYFKRSVSVPIKLCQDNETHFKKWLQTQPPLNRQDFQILEMANIPIILKYYGLEASVDNLTEPSYNGAGETTFSVPLKAGSPPGLKAVFLQARPNWMNYQYPRSPYQLSLTDLLTYEFEIARAFVFWDGRESQPPLNAPQIHLINYTDYLTNQEESAKPKAIKAYLTQQHSNYINRPMQIGSYNGTANTGMILPLPANATYEGKKIEAVYFDEGSRILPPNQNYALTDLLKLANGAQNIYLFYSEPRIKIITHNIDSIDSIPYIMRDKYGIDGINPHPSSPGYNDPYSKNLYWVFKQPNSDLLSVYFQAYPQKTYPFSHYDFSLDDLLTNTDTIEKAYIFKKSSNYDNLQKQAQEAEEYKERRHRELAEQLERKQAEREQREQAEIERERREQRERLERIQAEIEREREIIEREQREQAEREQREQAERERIFAERRARAEMERIENVKNHYYAELQKWQNQCYFKAGETYTGKQIREILGRTDKKLYCQNDGDIYIYLFLLNNKLTKVINATNSNHQHLLFYKYIPGYFIDSWYFSKYQNEYISYYTVNNLNNNNLLYLGSTDKNEDIKFETYCDTTPPPMKPDILN
ncbi:hypothetical protein [Candidatus Phytoplasma prunorum]|uniref:hypothetical protein n=1 Tax=Candidatus Phytoplasma prunorum TaxID=47565 RepID=UPI002FEFD685